MHAVALLSLLVLLLTPCLVRSQVALTCDLTSSDPEKPKVFRGNFAIPTGGGNVKIQAAFTTSTNWGVLVQEPKCEEKILVGSYTILTETDFNLTFSGTIQQCSYSTTSTEQCGCRDGDIATYTGSLDCTVSPNELTLYVNDFAITLEAGASSLAFALLPAALLALVMIAL